MAPLDAVLYWFMTFANAFILSFSDFGDYDRRFSLLTSEHGKLNAICKSILKPGAKLAGHLDIPNLSWVELVWSVRGWQITQALELESYPDLRRSPGALRSVLAAARRFDSLLFAEDDHEFRGRLTSSNTDNQNQNLFLTWASFLKALNNYCRQESAVDYDFLAGQCTIRLLHELGFLPDTFICSHCNQPLKSRFATYLENQFYCDACSHNLSLRSWQVPKPVLDLIQQGLKGVWFPESNYKQSYLGLARLFEQETRMFVI